MSEQETAARKGTEQGPPKGKVKFESVMPLSEAVAYFEAITAGLKKGMIKIKQGEHSLELSPPDQLDVEVKATRKSDHSSISFEISWRVASPSDLTITSS